MKRLLTTLFLAAIVVGGIWILVNQDRIRQSGGLSQFVSQQFPANGSIDRSYDNGNYFLASDPQAPNVIAPQRPSPMGLGTGLPDRIRVATFKLSGAQEYPDPELALGVLADLCSHFDVIAFQEIDGHRPGWLDELVHHIRRRTGGQADYQYASDHARVTRDQVQYAFLFNSRKLQLDHHYTVADPDNVLVREPLVGWFRTINVPPQRAFTFSLVNIQLAEEQPGNELAYFGQLHHAIRKDGRGEDDILFVGDFQSGDRALNALRKRSGMTWVVFDKATNTMNDTQCDNIVFEQTATLEFTGNGGVVDFLKEYNLGFRDAMAISDHMPVWAEFSAIERSK